MRYFYQFEPIFHYFALVSFSVRQFLLVIAHFESQGRQFALGSALLGLRRGVGGPRDRQLVHYWLLSLLIA